MSDQTLMLFLLGITGTILVIVALGRYFFFKWRKKDLGIRDRERGHDPKSQS